MDNTKEELAALKEDLARLIKSVEHNAMKTGEEIVKKAEQTFSSYAKSARKEAEPVVESISEASEEIDEFVKKYPWQSAGIALLGGLVIGILIGSQRR
jgi:ElaB/YqjD/DUF883 family membrane-anchored ribosome-binding protein